MEFQIIAGELCLDFINALDDSPFGAAEELLPTYQDLADWAVQAGALSRLQRTARCGGRHPSQGG